LRIKAMFKGPMRASFGLCFQKACLPLNCNQTSKQPLDFLNDCACCSAGFRVAQVIKH
jgi:hypothetical protein